jgi:RNA polymerase-binding transcription factor DksA
LWQRQGHVVLLAGLLKWTFVALSCLIRHRQQLEDERRTWEEHLQADVHAQHNALQQQHQQRLWEFDHALQEQERMAAAELKAEQDARLNDLRLELQVGRGWCFDGKY